MRSWFDAVGRVGLDRYLRIEMATDDIVRVQAAVAALTLAGLRLHTPGRGTTDGQAVVHYLDADRHAVMAAHLEGRRAPKVWAYRALTIGPDSVELARGGGLADTPQDDELILGAILGDPQITVQRWDVFAAGDGHPRADVAGGVGSASLADWLAQQR